MTLSRQIVHAVNAIPTPVGHGISAGQLLGHNQGINTQGMIYIVPISGAVQTLQASTAEIVGNDITLSANCAFTMPVASPVVGTQFWARVRQTNTMTTRTAAGLVLGGPYRAVFPTTTGAATLAQMATSGAVPGASDVLWTSTSPPSMSPGAGSVDYYEFEYNTGTVLTGADVTDTYTCWLGTAYQNLVEVSVNAQEYVYQVTASGVAVTLCPPNIAVGNDITLSANCVMTLPPGALGLQCWTWVRQPLIGGSYTYTSTFVNPGVTPTAVQWVKKTVPVQSAGAGAKDLYQFLWDSIGGVWTGVALQNFG